MKAALAGAPSVYRYTVRRTLGVGAGGWARALPVATALVAFVPAVVAVGVPALLERFVVTASSPIALARIRDLAADPSFVPTYPQYLFVISAVILIASAYAGAEAVAGDGEQWLRSLYRRAPLTPAAYLVAKCLGVSTALLVVTAGPLYLLLIGGVVNGGAVQPLDVLRIALASVIAVAPYAAVSLLAATIWRRRTVAAAAAVLVFTGSSAVARFVAGATGSEGWSLLDVRDAPLELAGRVLGGEALGGAPPTPLLAVAVVATTGACLAAIALRHPVGAAR